MNSSFKLCAVGDVSVYGRYANSPVLNVFSSIATEFESADLSIINLENPLIQAECGKPVEGKCTLRGSTGWASVLKATGINLVSLANNHMMDYGEEGLYSTMKALESVGLNYVGAGKDKQDANQPVFMEVKDQTVAVIARSSVVVASKSYAGDQTPGIAFLDIPETIKIIKECKEKSNTVILIIHWGIEQYKYPTPDQRRLAKEFIQAGVDIILGHHPHVLQGAETIEGSLVYYSMGNFLFDEFNWTFINNDGTPQESRFRLSESNRQSGLMVLQSSGTRYEHRFIPTVIMNDGTIAFDKSSRRLSEFKKLCDRLNLPGYKILWKLYSAKMEWGLRIKPLIRGKFTWEKIKKIRLSHFRQLFSTLKRALKITSEKSTNPYD